MEDGFPEGHPTINLREEVLKLAEQKVDLTVFRLNKTTDIMFGVMKKEYVKAHLNGFRIVNFMNSDQDENTSFYSQVSSQLMHSMNTCDPTD
jgi:hypothetical protein